MRRANSGRNSVYIEIIRPVSEKPMAIEGMRMTVEVFSDIMCPFCLLGKHRFANALARFAYRDDVDVIWRSFQLDPGLRTDPAVSVNEYLARRKGIDVDDARRMNDQLTRIGSQEGLVYNFDRAIPANTFDAHRLLHFAREHDKQSEMMERLFAAYFTEGKNVADPAVLADLANDVGLDPAITAAMLASTRYADQVRSDLREAAQFGINGVPFFVFDRRYAVYGAQGASVFLEALEQSYAATDV